MEYGIQRRNIYLTPPQDDELDWFYCCFDVPEVFEMFGFDGPGRMRMMRAHRMEQLVVSILRRAEDQKRIGFVVMFAPTERFDHWEFGYAIPEVSDRDAFSALNATDAMAHYMFEHLRVHAMGWRTRKDNRAADAVVRRLGYKSHGKYEENGHSYVLYRLDPEGWAKRRARLDRGEAKHPYGLGDTFLTLPEPPYTPHLPSSIEDA